MVDILTDEQRQAEGDLCQQGIDLIEGGKVSEAHDILEKAYNAFPESPRINSWYGLAIAMKLNQVSLALQHCRKAVDSDVPDVWFYRNIGKVYLMQRNKRAAIGAFAKGLTIEKNNSAILKEWKPLGFRRKPVIRFLSRDNGLNVLLGKFTWWLAHRNDGK